MGSLWERGTMFGVTWKFPWFNPSPVTSRHFQSSGSLNNTGFPHNSNHYCLTICWPKILEMYSPPKFNICSPWKNVKSGKQARRGLESPAWGNHIHHLLDNQQTWLGTRSTDSSVGPGSGAGSGSLVGRKGSWRAPKIPMFPMGWDTCLYIYIYSIYNYIYYIYIYICTIYIIIYILNIYMYYINIYIYTYMYYPNQLTPFPHHLLGKKVTIQTAHECSSLTKHQPGMFKLVVEPPRNMRSRQIESSPPQKTGP